jgi:hypothetical protein
MKLREHYIIMGTGRVQGQEMHFCHETSGSLTPESSLNSQSNTKCS